MTTNCRTQSEPNFRATADPTLAISWPLIEAGIDRFQRPPPVALQERRAYKFPQHVREILSLAPGSATLVQLHHAAALVAAARHQNPEATFRQERKSPRYVIVERLR